VSKTTGAAVLVVELLSYNRDFFVRRLEKRTGLIIKIIVSIDMNRICSVFGFHLFAGSGLARIAVVTLIGSDFARQNLGDQNDQHQAQSATRIILNSAVEG
jgi:hypothetical protein